MAGNASANSMESDLECTSRFYFLNVRFKFMKCFGLNIFIHNSIYIVTYKYKFYSAQFEVISGENNKKNDLYSNPITFTTLISNFLCFASFCAHLCAISNNFKCNDENRILGK